MRRIVHISDVHFGREDQKVVGSLIVKIRDLEPHLVIVSGDLTQRARSGQFRRARAFLDSLPKPQLVVPGNHDVPLYNVIGRFARPLENYKRFITDDLGPFFADEEIAVVGVNTTRSFTIKGGRILPHQVAELRRRMGELGDKLLKIVVTHHPFDVPEGQDENNIVENAKEAMPLLAECGADVFLSGHLHISSISHSAHRYKLESGRSALIVQAGTAASTRERGEENSFNLLEHDVPVLTVKRFQCGIPSAGFHLATEEQFTATGAGWERL
jgi:3',5'-cyclic AMP phosphodiesterase CpdA